MPNQNFVGRSL